MVFGRLFRSIGLGKPQAVQEEKALSISSDSDEDSVTDDVLSTESTVYSKDMILQFRMFANEQDAGEITEVLPVAKEEEQEAKDEEDKPLDIETTPSTRSTPKSGAARGSPKSIETTPSSQLDALTPTAGSWVAAMQSKRSMQPDETAEDEKVNRKACSILNKLTVEKFDSLFEQLATCGIKKPKHLEMLMCEVFNKATTQHHFIAMYADLCVRLEQDNRISSVVDSTGQQHSFRRLLLNQCQMSFEKLLQGGDTLQQDAEKYADAEELAIKRKQQALGNIKLIGHLLVQGIVTSKLLVECSEELLRSRDSCPEALESLAALLTVAGKRFDTPSWQHHSRLLEVFSNMRSLSKDKATPSRVRFLLRDVLDVRDAGWSNCTYKQTLATAPMKLDEVRESAANEGKYMSLDDQIETDTLLSGLMRVSKMANSKKDRPWEGYSSPDSTPMQSLTQKRRNAPDVSTKKYEAAEKRGSPTARPLGPKPWEKAAAEKKKCAGGNPPGKFDVVSFRRALAQILADLSADKNVPAAVRRIRLQEVPEEFQSKEFADIITRIVEERRGPVRRCALTFAAGLGAADESAFERAKCIEGIGQFFNEVYPELCKEIPRLPAIANSELLPTLRNVYSDDELDPQLPPGLDSVSK